MQSLHHHPLYLKNFPNPKKISHENLYSIAFERFYSLIKASDDEPLYYAARMINNTSNINQSRLDSRFLFFFSEHYYGDVLLKVTFIIT